MSDRRFRTASVRRSRCMFAGRPRHPKHNWPACLNRRPSPSRHRVCSPGDRQEVTVALSIRSVECVAASCYLGTCSLAREYRSLLCVVTQSYAVVYGQNQTTSARGLARRTRRVPGREASARGHTASMPVL